MSQSRKFSYTPSSSDNQNKSQIPRPEQNSWSQYEPQPIISNPPWNTHPTPPISTFNQDSRPQFHSFHSSSNSSRSGLGSNGAIRPVSFVASSSPYSSIETQSHNPNIQPTAMPNVPLQPFKFDVPPDTWVQCPDYPEQPNRSRRGRGGKRGRGGRNSWRDSKQSTSWTPQTDDLNSVRDGWGQPTKSEWSDPSPSPIEYTQQQTTGLTVSPVSSVLYDTKTALSEFEAISDEQSSFELYTRSEQQSSEESTFHNWQRSVFPSFLFFNPNMLTLFSVALFLLRTKLKGVNDLIQLRARKKHKSATPQESPTPTDDQDDDSFVSPFFHPSPSPTDPSDDTNELDPIFGEPLQSSIPPLPFTFPPHGKPFRACIHKIGECLELIVHSHGKAEGRRYPVVQFRAAPPETGLPYHFNDESLPPLLKLVQQIQTFDPYGIQLKDLFPSIAYLPRSYSFSDIVTAIVARRLWMFVCPNDRPEDASLRSSRWHEQIIRDYEQQARVGKKDAKEKRTQHERRSIVQQMRVRVEGLVRRQRGEAVSDAGGRVSWENEKSELVLNEMLCCLEETSIQSRKILSERGQMNEGREWRLGEVMTRVGEEIGERMEVDEEETVQNDEVYEIQTDNVGFQMLMKLGWKGKGLGVNEDGITQPIENKKRTKREGIGMP
ncbi:hypothetical protein BLNAU_5956 [Blattamonas nauphoetae]|uniref:G-patch domain-containing protein n=1 Tax=Blattamonas nauphoetae TaxID=2049346 RepID=A0ABQ9Y611_9EUKA|nr:hypothetical protein BLNAU_5956 [Blattamonas nauphoetae]